MRTIDVCFSPALFPHYATEDSIVVIVDIFRATTSICAAFQNGASGIKTVASIEEAICWKEKGRLVAAERDTKKCSFADFGNSPFDFTSDKVAEKEIIFTTTNGTQAVEAAINAREIIIGAYSNISCVFRFLNSNNLNVIILCSGWNNRFCLEDTIFAGALSAILLESNSFAFKSDSVSAAIQLWQLAKPDLNNYICRTEHYDRLLKNGVENSVEYCLSFDTTTVLPRYIKSESIFKNSMND